MQPVEPIKSKTEGNYSDLSCRAELTIQSPKNKVVAHDDDQSEKSTEVPSLDSLSIGSPKNSKEENSAIEEIAQNLTEMEKMSLVS